MKENGTHKVRKHLIEKTPKLKSISPKEHNSITISHLPIMGESIFLAVK